MIFGTRSGERVRMTDGYSGAGAAVRIAACFSVVGLSLAGCSGGSSSGTHNTGATPPPGQASGSTATITGTVTDPELSQAVDPGAVVAFGKYYSITGANGAFTLIIPSGTAGTVTVYGKAVRDANGNVVLDGATGLPQSDNTYTNTGYYPASGTTQVALHSVGIPIPALNANQIDDIGTIGLLTINDPPPPPPI